MAQEISETSSPVAPGIAGESKTSPSAAPESSTQGAQENATASAASSPLRVSKRPKLRRVSGKAARKSVREEQEDESDTEDYPVGCPSCQKAISPPIPKQGGNVQCTHCNQPFDCPPKEEIEKLRLEAPSHHWTVIAEGGRKLSIHGLEKISQAISDGTLLPTYDAVTGPFLPAESVRKLAENEGKLKKLYDPVSVFSEFWSWALVGLLPAALLSLIALIAGGHPAIGLLWLALIGIMLGSTGLFIVATLLTGKGGCGQMLVILLTGVVGYFILLIVGALSVALLMLLHKAMTPLGRVLGRMCGVERKRISNWADWMVKA